MNNLKTVDGTTADDPSFVAGKPRRQTGLYIAQQEVERCRAQIEHLQGKLEAQIELTAKFEALVATTVREKDDYIAERAQAHLKELEEEKKQHGYTKSNKDSYYRQNQDLEKELNGMHEILDLLPFAPPRKYKDRNDYDQERSLTVRFSTMVAIQASNK